MMASRDVGNVVSWEILPTAQLCREQLEAHLAGLAKPGHEYEPDRIDAAWSLEPVATFRGVRGMLGYVVFLYANRQHVLVEHPFRGNAAYVLPAESWQGLTELTRHALREAHADEISRVVHSGNWRVGQHRVLGHVARLLLLPSKGFWDRAQAE